MCIFYNSLKSVIFLVLHFDLFSYTCAIFAYMTCYVKQPVEFETFYFLNALIIKYLLIDHKVKSSIFQMIFLHSHSHFQRGTWKKCNCMRLKLRSSKSGSDRRLRATCTKTAAHTWHADAIWKLLLFWPTVARSRRSEPLLDERSFRI